MGNTSCSKSWQFTGGPEARNTAAPEAGGTAAQALDPEGQTDISVCQGGTYSPSLRPPLLSLEGAVILPALASFHGNIHLQSPSKSI